MLFDQTITNLKDWGEIFQEKALFEPLAEAIFRQLGQPCPGLENCTPGSNAVFRAGASILKIFAPEESGIGGESEFLAEQYGLERAAQRGVPAPKLLASGVIRDKYVFRWLLLERLEGETLAEAAEKLSPDGWYDLGCQLRALVERLDGPCAPFHDRGLGGPPAEERWALFSQGFRDGRRALLDGVKPENTFVHGDLNADNLMVTPEGKLYAIDFADARTAPFETELAALVCDGFRFHPAYLRGFLGNFDQAELIEKLTRGLLIHDYGAWIIRDRIAPPHTLGGLDDLKRSLLCCLNR